MYQATFSTSILTLVKDLVTRTTTHLHTPETTLVSTPLSQTANVTGGDLQNTYLLSSILGSKFVVIAAVRVFRRS